MPNLMDLPADVRARVLAKIGLTEEQYIAQRDADRAAALASNRPPVEDDPNVHPCMKDIPNPVIGD